MARFDTIKQLNAESKMDKEWYILIEGQKEGPYSFHDLKVDKRMTPDTLVWKEGWKKWVAVRLVSELEDLFSDEFEEEAKPLHEDVQLKPSSSDLISEQEALTIQQDPSQFFLWILVFILILLYVFYQFYK